MLVTLGIEGLDNTWQAPFPKTVDCCHCEGEARIGFVAHEGLDGEKLDYKDCLCELHENKPKNMWLHDCCAVAVYFCRSCLGVTAKYNQG